VGISSARHRGCNSKLKAATSQFFFERSSRVAALSVLFDCHKVKIPASWGKVVPSASRRGQFFSSYFHGDRSNVFKKK